MTSGSWWNVGDLVIVKPGHGKQDDLKPWMENGPAKIIDFDYDENEDDERIPRLSWGELPRTHPAIVEAYATDTDFAIDSWYVSTHHLEPYRPVDSSHDLW